MVYRWIAIDFESLLFPQTNWLKCKPFSEFLGTPNIRQKPELKIKRHGCTRHYRFLDFSFFPFMEWKSMSMHSKQYNFIQWFSFNLQIFDFKTWKNKATSHKIYWDYHFFQKSPQPLGSINADGFTNYTKTLLWTNYWSTLLI